MNTVSVVLKEVVIEPGLILVEVKKEHLVLGSKNIRMGRSGVVEKVKWSRVILYKDLHFG